MSEQNKACFQQFIDGMNAKDPDFVDRFSTRISSSTTPNPVWSRGSTESSR